MLSCHVTILCSVRVIDKRAAVSMHVALVTC